MPTPPCHPPAHSARLLGKALPCPALLCGLARAQGQESPAAGASSLLLSRQVQEALGGQLARWEPFSGVGAEGETRTLNKAETEAVRLKEAEHSPVSCSGQRDPGWMPPGEGRV